MANFYVNIDVLYTGTHTGTSANPFTWTEFMARVTLGGTGANTDVYYLAGSRNIGATQAHWSRFTQIRNWNADPFRIKGNYSGTYTLRISGTISGRKVLGMICEFGNTTNATDVGLLIDGANAVTFYNCYISEYRRTVVYNNAYFYGCTLLGRNSGAVVSNKAYTITVKDCYVANLGKDTNAGIMIATYSSFRDNTGDLSTDWEIPDFNETNTASNGAILDYDPGCFDQTDRSHFNPFETTTALSPGIHTDYEVGLFGTTRTGIGGSYFGVNAFYVNLNLSDSLSAIGSTAGQLGNPYNFLQFVTSVSGYPGEDITYYMKGSLNIANFSAYNASNNLVIGNGASVSSTYYILPWDLSTNGPWMMKFRNDGINIKSSPKLVVEQGLIESKYFRIISNGLSQNSNAGYTGTFTSMHIRVDGDSVDAKNSIKIENGSFYSVRFFGSTIIIPNNYSFGLGLDEKAVFENSILDFQAVYAGTAVTVSTFFQIEYCSLTSSISGLSAKNITSGGSSLLGFVSNVNQQNWSHSISAWPLFSAVSAANVSAAKDLFSYLKPAVRTLSAGSVSRAITNQYNTKSLYGLTNDLRDGPGALYFPLPDGTFSASPVSGFAPLTVNFTYPSTSANYYGTRSLCPNATNLVCNVNPLLSANGISASYVYSTAGTYAVYGNITSKNAWNATDVDTISNINVSAVLTPSATFSAVGFSTGTKITSAFINEQFKLSAVSQQNVSKWKYNLGNSQILSANGTLPSTVTVSYPTSGTYNISLTVYNSMNVSASAASASMSISDPLVYDFYVDINLSADSITPHTGTVSSPYTFQELQDRIKLGGDGIEGSKYRLRGERLISATDAFYTFEADHTKNFVVDAWNLSAYGPWLITLNDTNTNVLENHDISFHGCDIRNGIIYNKPYFYQDIYHGGRITISDTHDMLITENGSKGTEAIIIEPFLVSATGVSSPSWVNLSSYIEDDFDNGIINTWWSTANVSAGALMTSVSAPYPYDPSDVDNYMITVYANVTPDIENTVKYQLTPYGTTFSGDFEVALGWFTKEAFIDSRRVALHIDSGIHSENKCYLFISNNVMTWYNGSTQETISYPCRSFGNYGYMRIKRTGTSVSASWSSATNFNNDPQWVNFTNTLTYSGTYNIKVDPSTKIAISTIRAQGTGYPVSTSGTRGSTGEWTVRTNSTNTSIGCMVDVSNNIFAGGNTGGYLYKYDTASSATQWTIVASATSADTFSAMANQNDLYYRASDGYIYAASTAYNQYIEGILLRFHSTSGTTWQQIANTTLASTLFCVTEFNNEIYCAGDSGHLFKWNGTSTLETCAAAYIYPPTNQIEQNIHKMIVHNNELYATTSYHGLLLKFDSVNHQWIKMASQFSATSGTSVSASNELSVSSTPSWVTMSKYVGDRFSNGLFDSWWSSNFKTWPIVQFYPNSDTYAARYNSQTGFHILSPDNWTIASNANFQMEFEIVVSGTPVYAALPYPLTSFELALFNNFWPNIRCGYLFNGERVVLRFMSQYEEISIPLTPYSNPVPVNDPQTFERFNFKITRTAGLVRAYYMVGFTWEFGQTWTQFPLTFNNTDAFTVGAYGDDVNPIGLIRIELQDTTSFPYTSAAPRAIPSSGWLTMNTFIEDNFSDRRIDPYWDRAFKEIPIIELPAGSQNYTVYPEQYNSLTLTPTSFRIIASSNFILQWEITLQSTSWYISNSEVTPIVLINVGNVYLGWQDASSFVQIGATQEWAPIPIVSYQHLHFKIVRTNGLIVCSYAVASGPWIAMTTTGTLATDITSIGLLMAGGAGITNLKFQADTGFPYRYTAPAPVISTSLVTHLYDIKEYNNKLYAPTSIVNGDAAQLLTFNSSTSAWEQAAAQYDNSESVKSLAILQNEIYGCTNKFSTVNGGELLKWNGSNAWIKVISPIAGETGLNGMDVIASNNALYAVTIPNGKLLELTLGGIKKANIVGSTIYSSGKFINAIQSDIYELYIKDSVIRNFVPISVQNYDGAQLYMYNNVFDKSHLDMQNNFTIIQRSKNQYNFSMPSVYPFATNETSLGYNKDLSWIRANKELFRPFQGISTPPKPGYGYPSYTDYPTGLFGYSRSNNGIGAFYFGPINITVSAGFIDVVTNVNTSLITEQVIIQTTPIVMRVGVVANQSVSGTSDYTVDFIGVPHKGNSPLVVEFTDLTVVNQAGYGVTERQWDFGDGSPIAITSDEKIIHTYSGPFGTKYDVTLSVRVQNI